MPGKRRGWAYFDTSALVKCYVQDSGRAEVLNLVSRYAVVSSAVAPVELVGALRRQESERWITAEQRRHAVSRFGIDRARWTLLALDTRILARAEALAAA